MDKKKPRDANNSLGWVSKNQANNGKNKVKVSAKYTCIGFTFVSFRLAITIMLHNVIIMQKKGEYGNKFNCSNMKRAGNL